MAMSPNVAVLGCGYWGKNLARNFAELGALVALSDPDVATAAREAEKNRVPARDTSDILADRAIGAVAIAAPAEHHAELALAALAAGKHVFVEKPLALNREDGEAIVAAAQGAGRILMVGHLLRYHPAFEALLSTVRSGRIGRLRYAYSHRLSLGKLRVEENVLWSFAPHDVSMLLALFGERPDRVEARGGSFVTPGIEDEHRLDMTFPGGGRAHVFASWLHPFKEHRLVVVGEKGMIVFEDSAADPKQKLRLYAHGMNRSGRAPEPVKAEPEPIAFGLAEPLKQECSHFLDCISSNAQPRTDGTEALAVLDVLLRAGETRA
ncbi:MAG: Gfo/Idh/MocA family oxidoreductase [Parvularculaceae bacterium]|nr:Gfo/Idh/MocA family oxidoreductase [Parvularculaceae bacterium]